MNQTDPLLLQTRRHFFHDCALGLGSVTAASAADRIPVTTSSAEAREAYLKGRDLSERLLGQESLQHFDKALSLDPEFASAELARANRSLRRADTSLR